MLCVTTHTPQQHGAERVLKQESHEIETRNGLDYASVVIGESVARGECRVDPTEVRRVSGAPDHVRHLQHPSALEDRVTVPRTRGLSDPLDACPDAVLGPDTRGRG